MTTAQDTRSIADLLREKRGNDYKSEAARDIGVSRQIYDAWETSHFIPGDEWAEPISIYLGIDLAEVVLRLYNDRARKLGDRTQLDITWKDGHYAPWADRPTDNRPATREAA